MRPILIIAFLFTFSFSCTEKPSKCSEIFIYHLVKIYNANHQPLILNSYYTINDATNDTLRLPKVTGDSSHFYPIISDTYNNQLTENVKSPFTFHGVINGDTIKSPYVFSFKKCHVTYESGATTLVYIP